MRYFFSISIIILLTSCATTKNWKVVWQDDFNNSQIDTTVWSLIPRGGLGGWSAYMTKEPEFTAIEDGKLVLKADRNQDYPSDTSQYLTGGLWTKHKKTFQNGKMEICAKLESARGFWPALWLNADNWPNGGEIDIMEHLNFDTFVYQTIHSYYSLRLKMDMTPPHYAIKAFNPSEYNVFAVEMYNDSLVFSVNGNRSFAYPRIETDKEGQFPFIESNFFLILSSQLAGSWVGPITPSDLPVNMTIDWVRFSKRRHTKK